MTTIVKDTAAKFAVAAVAVAMIFSAYAPAAQAQTTDEMSDLIASLLQQVADLQSQLGQGSTGDSMGSSSDVCPYTWTRDLNMGSEGADVMKLQQFLNANADTRVAATGAGSAGNETMYYGPATGAAVSKFQVMYRAEVLTPAGLVNPTTYFGPSTRAKANATCVAAPVDNGGEEEGEEMEEEEEMEEGELEGEGVLVTFEVDDEEDTLSEGDEDVAVAMLTLEAEDGDVEISRMDFTLVADAGTANEEDEPWDVFTEVSLWVDGDKVASFEADDEDEYLDEDDGEFRFSNLDLVLREDDETEVTVAVSVMNSVDGSDVANAADWNIAPVSVRYFDADGVATTETSLDEMGDAEHFDIEEEGTDDKAEIESNSDTPEAATLLVDEDTDESDEFSLHLFDIEVDDESGDLEVGNAYVDVTVENPTGGVALTMADVIDGIFMTIDGEEVEGEATDVLGSDDGDADETEDGEIDHSVAATETNTVRFLFEFDQDVTLETDTDYEVEIAAVFEGQDTNYSNGVIITTAVTGSTWEVEGAANDDELEGSDTSEEATLATVVPVISDLDSESDEADDNSNGTISFTFTVGADEDDVVLAVADNADVDGAVDDVMFTVSGTDTAIAVASLTKISGDATYGGGNWTINDGDDATFALDVTFTPVDSGDNGTYYVNLDTIGGVEVDENEGGVTISI